MEGLKNVEWDVVDLKIVLKLNLYKGQMTNISLKQTWKVVYGNVALSQGLSREGWDGMLVIPVMA